MAYSRAELEAFQLLLKEGQKRGGDAVRSAVLKWMREHPSWDVDDLRAVSEQALGGSIAEWGPYMQSVACDLYDTCTADAGYPRAVPSDIDLSGNVERTVRYQLRKALDGDGNAYADSLAEAASNYLRRCANETIVANVGRDGGSRAVYRAATGRDRMVPRSGGRSRSLQIGDLAYARVPTGARTCTYCMMLASRGFKYRSEDSAGRADHRGCDCLIVPGRYGVDAIEGIDTDAQYECWRDLESLEAHARTHPDEFDADELERRRNEIIGRYDGLTLSDDPGEVRKHISESDVLGWYTPRQRMAASYDVDANARL